MQAPPINQEQTNQLLEWLDSMNFSRPKRNLSRDFADGVLVAQIIKAYFPRLVQLHNYPAGSALNAKYSNWKTLNEKVMKKLRFQVHPNDIQAVINIVPGAVQRVLFYIFGQIQRQGSETRQDFNPSQSTKRINIRQEQSEGYMQQLALKQEAIEQLRGTIQILETKMKRMQELNRLKDAKIESLIRKLQEGVN